VSHEKKFFFFIEKNSIFLFLFYQKKRFDHLNSISHHPGDESDKYVGTSAATTVVRKTTHPPPPPSSSTVKTVQRSSDVISRSIPLEQNHKVLTNKHALEQHQHRASMRQSSSSKNHPDSFHSNYSGQQLLLTSGDIEAMTMKQFRIGSIGC
jgi:hypothetical protein